MTIKGEPSIINNETVIQFLLLGSSHGHIIPVIDTFSTSKIIFFSSESLIRESKFTIEAIEEKYNVQCDLEILKPFEENAIHNMTKRILIKSEELLLENDNRFQPTIISGVTGGTNLMAISMALAAMIKGWRCHYVVKSIVSKDQNENDILEINLFNELNKKYNLNELYNYFNDQRIE